MSQVKVEVVSVDDVQPHPNADRLDIAQIKGWTCVVGKGSFKKGDLGVYFPIDCVLPPKLEAKIFGPDSKVKLSGGRVKTIKLRGAISQGLLVQPIEIADLCKPGWGEAIVEGADLSDELGVTKYEPPVSKSPQSNVRQTSKKQTNPYFHKYSDIENWKNHPNLFQRDEWVWVLEKIHGSNFRAGYVPTHASTWWKKVKKFFGLLPSHEFVFGSHNVQLQDRWTDKTWYRLNVGISNIYEEAVEKYNLRNVLKAGEVVYGEVYGDGVQKGYLYDCQPGERRMRVFDVKVNDTWLDHIDVMLFCTRRDLLSVPVDAAIYYDEDRIRGIVSRPSNLTLTRLREGVVIKPTQEAAAYLGRKILKWKSDEFLLHAEDDVH